MTTIWHHGGSSWALLPPAGFPDEATRHVPIAKAPQLLPLAGSPSRVIVGCAVPLASAWADLVALEPSGRTIAPGGMRFPPYRRRNGWISLASPTRQQRDECLDDASPGEAAHGTMVIRA